MCGLSGHVGAKGTCSTHNPDYAENIVLTCFVTILEYAVERILALWPENTIDHFPLYLL